MLGSTTLLTESSLKRLDHQSDLQSGPLIDFVQGLILQKREEWFEQHKPLSKQIVEIVARHKTVLEPDMLASITAIFLMKGWFVELKEYFISDSKNCNIFDHFLKTGSFPENIPKEKFPDIIKVGQNLQNPSFLKTFSNYFISFLVSKGEGFEHISLFKGSERDIVQAYFSVKKIKTLLINSQLHFHFSELGNLINDPSFQYAQAYIEGLCIDEKTDPAEVGIFPVIDSEFKRSIKYVLVNGYTGPIEPILKGLTDLRELILVNVRPTHRMLAILMGIAFKLKKIEFNSPDKKAIDIEPINVSSVLFKYLEDKEINFPYRKISSVIA